MARRIALLLVAAITLSGCARGSEPVRDSREALGTVVSVTAYTSPGADESEVREGLDAAYAAMAAAELALNAHDYASPIAKINDDLEGELPPEALEVLSAIERLGVAGEYSPYLFEVIALYDFENGGSVPDTATLAGHVASNSIWRVDGNTINHRGNRWIKGAYPSYPSGLDFGGAAKGLALDRAAEALEGSSAVEAALVTAGSTTVTFGSKPDGEPWRVGVEDPRDPEGTIATVEATSAVTVSTSGDYQRFFERDGVRYHHILDPATGLPARGLQSLTVVGAGSGLDSDILSTALFVMGADRAAAFAQANDLGLVLVDDEGRVRVVPGPEDADWRIVETNR